MIDPTMGYELDPARRSAEKAASRDRDRRRLDSGEVSRKELARENNFFRDIHSTEIVAIGGKPIKPRP
jgi:hypothetical protein